MSTPYTSSEIWTKIRALDTEIADLRTRPLNYRIGSKWVDRDRQLELLLKERNMWQTQAAGIASDNVSEKHVVPDYEMDSTGVQQGETLTGAD